MLVTSVVLRAGRATLGATVVETVDAIDDYSIGAIFATLNDAPGNALDSFEAFVGQRSVEAASASATETATVVAAPGGAGPKRDGLVGAVFVNSDGTPRQAYANGAMVNL